MIAQGLVLLSQNDGDAPALPAVATVSKDDAWEDGGYQLGAAAAAAGRVWIDRPYFTGNPSVEWMVQKCDRVTAAGGYAQCGNEQNLPLEGWVGGPAAWWSFEDAVRAQAAHPERVLGMPPSPGVPGWEDWVGLTGPFAVHAYGSFDQMRAVVEAYLEETTGDLYVTECNPGAGQSFDLDAWAAGELVPFLDWCAGEPRVKAVAYFAWRWDQSASLPSSIDAAGTAVDDVLRDWVPPANGGSMDEEWYPDAEQRPISRNYTPGRAGGPVRAVVEHIAEGMGSPFGWFDEARPNPSSAHFWVSREGLVEQYRPLSDTCWANGPIHNPDLTNPAVTAIVVSGQDPNALTVAVEHEGYSGDPLSTVQIDASRALTAWLGARYGLPVSRDAVIGHYQLDSVNKPFCPGPAFPWESVLGEAPDPLPDLQDRTWRALDDLQTLADEWEAYGWPSTATGISSAAEAGKSLVRSSKSER